MTSFRERTGLNERTDAEEAGLVRRHVDRHPGVLQPPEPDEERLLAANHGEPDADANGSPLRAAVAQTGTAAAMLAEARRWLGVSGRPNTLTRAYSSRHGSYFANAPWCDIAVTEWARRSGAAAAVLPGGDRAYTVWHAQDFQKIGRWHGGTTASVNAAKPGDIVFFDWGASNSVGAIDHVGVVEKNLGGGRVQTIEGNTGNAVRRRVRAASVIAGYGRPAYQGSTGGGKPPGSTWMEDIVKNLPLLKQGSRGEHVQTLQGLLQARSHKEVAIDGDFGPATQKALRAVQRWGGVTVDGECGPRTWPVLLRVHQ